MIFSLIFLSNSVTHMQDQTILFSWKKLFLIELFDGKDLFRYSLWTYLTRVLQEYKKNIRFILVLKWLVNKLKTQSFTGFVTKYGGNSFKDERNFFDSNLSQSMKFSQFRERFSQFFLTEKFLSKITNFETFPNPKISF